MERLCDFGRFSAHPCRAAATWEETRGGARIAACDLHRAIRDAAGGVTLKWTMIAAAVRS